MPHIHGHEVMHMMANSGQSYTRETLRSAIQKQFGSDTTYFTKRKLCRYSNGVTKLTAR